MLINRILSVQIFFRTTHMWNFSSYIFLWNVYFDTIRGLKSLRIAHINCTECFLFAFMTDPSFQVSLFDNKDGLLLETPYTVGSGCPVLFAVCDPLIPALNNFKWQISSFWCHFWTYIKTIKLADENILPVNFYFTTFSLQNKRDNFELLT